MKKKKRNKKKSDGTVEAAHIQAAGTVKAAWIGFWALIIVALISFGLGFLPPPDLPPEPSAKEAIIIIIQVHPVDQESHYHEALSAQGEKRSPDTLP